MSRRQRRKDLLFLLFGVIVVCTNLYVASTLRGNAADDHHNHGGAAEIEQAPETHPVRSANKPRHHHEEADGAGKPVTGEPPEGTSAPEHHHPQSRDGTVNAGSDEGSKAAIAKNKPKLNNFSAMAYDDGVKAYTANIATDIGTVNLSSIHFDAVQDPSRGGMRLPDTPIVAKSAGASISDDPRCSPSDNRFTAESDTACKAYLADPANWESIKPKKKIKTRHDIKFRLFLRNGAVALMKVPQHNFVLEPSSEVEAFETDRLIGFRRAPPVAWVSFPLKYLQAACGSVVLSDTTARKLPLKSQRSAFYSQWFQKSVVEDKQAAAALHADPATNETMLFVSLYVLMNDVHNVDETALRPPSNYRELLMADEPFPEDASNWTRAAISELSDVSLFDFIIGNTDRWFTHARLVDFEIWQWHNIFTFGGCSAHASVRPGPDCHKPTARSQILGVPTYAFIDQGSSFTKTGPQSRTLYTGSKAKPTVDDLCRFRKASAEGILAVARPEKGHRDYYAEMLARLPKGIFSIGSKYLVKAARTRVEHLATMIEHCLERYPPEDVFFF